MTGTPPVAERPLKGLWSLGLHSLTSHPEARVSQGHRPKPGLRPLAVPQFPGDLRQGGARHWSWWGGAAAEESGDVARAVTGAQSWGATAQDPHPPQWPLKGGRSQWQQPPQCPLAWECWLSPNLVLRLRIS